MGPPRSAPVSWISRAQRQAQQRGALFPERGCRARQPGGQNRRLRDRPDDRAGSGGGSHLSPPRARGTGSRVAGGHRMSGRDRLAATADAFRDRSGRPSTRAGDPVVADLPGVGENLQDHLNIPVKYACSDPSATMDRWQRPDRALWLGLTYFSVRGRAGPGRQPVLGGWRFF